MVQRASLMEGLNSSEAKALFASVTDLYDELVDFEQDAPSAAINALTPHLNKVKETLEQIMQNPMSYVAPTKNPAKEKQVVTLKPVKN